MELTHIIVVYYDYEIVFGLKLVGNRAVYIYVPNNTRLKTLNPCAGFELVSEQKNDTEIHKIVCDRCPVNRKINFHTCFFL